MDRTPSRRDALKQAAAAMILPFAVSTPSTATVEQVKPVDEPRRQLVTEDLAPEAFRATEALYDFLLAADALVRKYNTSDHDSSDCDCPMCRMVDDLNHQSYVIDNFAALNAGELFYESNSRLAKKIDRYRHDGA